MGRCEPARRPVHRPSEAAQRFRQTQSIRAQTAAEEAAREASGRRGALVPVAAERQNRIKDEAEEEKAQSECKVVAE